MSKRKNIPYESVGLRMDQSDSDTDDPELGEILKIWKEPVVHPFRNDLDPQQESISIWKWFENYSHIVLVFLVAIFILLCNHYNDKQLAKIREDYGMTTKEHLPELWWEKALFYKLIVRSYKDSNGDGIGDLKGVEMNSDHLLYIMPDAVIISGILESPYLDFGRDVTNFTSVSSEYGSFVDFVSLLNDFHQKDMKVILEISFNQCSKRHMWFQNSRNDIGNYSEFFIWSPGKVLTNGTIVPQNNWMNRYGQSAWTYDNIKKQYYYHHYSPESPDLNLRNPLVWHQVQSTIQYWASIGVDGFVLQDLDVYFEVEDLSLDEPEKPMAANEQVEGYLSLDHLYTVDSPDMHDRMLLLRELIEDLSDKYQKKIGFIASASQIKATAAMRYYNTGAHNIVTLNLGSLQQPLGFELHDVIDSFRTRIPPEASPMWVLGDTQYGRLLSRLPHVYQNAMNMLALLLPGAAFCYMGDELALPSLPIEVTEQLFGSLYAATFASHMAPMPWSSGPGGGFSKMESPWLPLVPQYALYSVEHLRNQHVGTSSLHLYGQLARLRKEISFRNGEFQYSLVSNQVFSFVTFAKNNAPYLVAVNVGMEEELADFTLTAGVPYGKVMAYSQPVGGSRAGGLAEGQSVRLDKMLLKPGEGVVVLLLLDALMEL